MVYCCCCRESEEPLHTSRTSRMSSHFRRGYWPHVAYIADILPTITSYFLINTIKSRTSIRSLSILYSGTDVSTAVISSFPLTRIYAEGLKFFTYAGADYPPRISTSLDLTLATNQPLKIASTWHVPSHDGRWNVLGYIQLGPSIFS